MCIGVRWDGDVCECGSLCGRGICADCILQMTIIRGTLMTVIVQNLNEIRQSAAELKRFSYLDLAAVRHLGYLRQAYMDHSTHCGNRFSTYTKNLVKIC